MSDTTEVGGAGTDEARILGRGYRPYEGTRAGLVGAVSSVSWHSFRLALGMGRPARHKILPVVTATLSFLPAVVFAGLILLVSDLATDDIGLLIEYHEYYGFSGFAVVLFCGLVVPDVLVADRRTGMLGLYLSTPLKRWSYLVAKAQAVMNALVIVTIAPLLVLLLAYTFSGEGPDGFDGWVITAGRIGLAGLAYATVFTSVGMAVASLTDRRAIASVGVIGLIIGSSVVTGMLVEVAEMSANFYVLNLLSMPFAMVAVIFGEPNGPPELSALLVVLANVAWAVVGGILIWWRYRRLAAKL